LAWDSRADVARHTYLTYLRAVDLAPQHSPPQDVHPHHPVGAIVVDRALPKGAGAGVEDLNLAHACSFPRTGPSAATILRR
jgi:hypothetical protein